VGRGFPLWALVGTCTVEATDRSWAGPWGSGAVANRGHGGPPAHPGQQLARPCRIPSGSGSGHPKTSRSETSWGTVRDQDGPRLAVDVRKGPALVVESLW